MTRHTVFSTGPLKGAATGLAALLAFAAFAWAGAQDDCAQKDDRGLRIDACTEMINSDEFSSRERAVAHFNRGSARDSLGDIPGAIEDYDAALRLDPEMGAAYYNLPPLLPTTTGARLIASSAMINGRLRISARHCGSIRPTPTLIATAAWSMKTWAGLTGQSATGIRKFSWAVRSGRGGGRNT
jgi:hypothetical protein